MDQALPFILQTLAQWQMADDLEKQNAELFTIKPRQRAALFSLGIPELWTTSSPSFTVPLLCHNSPQFMSISSHEAVPDGSFRHADVSLAQQLLGLLAVWDEPRQQKEYKSR